MPEDFSVIIQPLQDFSVVIQPPEFKTVSFEGGAQGPAGIPPVWQLSNVMYDIPPKEKRVLSFTRSGNAYVVAYPNSTTIVITGGGRVRTVTKDVLDRITFISDLSAP